MPPTPIAYLLPEGVDLAMLRQRLAESRRLHEDAPEELCQTYYDSFDWRVWQAEGELVLEENGAGRLCWFERAGEGPQECLPLEGVPRYWEALPEVPLRQRLGGLLEMRALIPQVKVLQRLSTLRLLDDEEKTVARVVLLESTWRSLDGRARGPLAPRVVLKPLKGYDRHFENLREQLEALELARVERSLYEESLAGIGRRAGDYSSKLNYILDPEARSDATAKKILLSLLDTLQANVEGTKANLDSEFLHDLRVATRRTRSAMSHIKGVFDARELTPFKKDFGWLGRITGPTRDLDVYLLQFPAYRAMLPAELQGDLDPFHRFLLKHHKQAQEALAKRLDSPHFRKLMKQWRAWLQAPPPEWPKAPNALRPIAELADQRIGKLYRKVLQEGDAITSDSEPERLHELRKECKKLRYMVEFFQSLYSKPEIRQLIKVLKSLLDNLGEFQDLQVQAHTLEEFGQQMQKEGAPASALMAMGILVGKLLERQAQARDSFAELFADFGSDENRSAFLQLFGG